jgi:1-acyl-sn-glycerol-3-phosphate acyltransferase
MFRKIVQPFYTTYAVTTFVLCFFAAFPFIVWYGKRKNAVARGKITIVTRYCFRCWLWLTGMPLQQIGKRPVGKHVFVANHTSYLDTISIVPALQEHFRILGKEELLKIPFYGYLYKQMVIPVDRENMMSRATSIRRMLGWLKKEGSIVIFPEGTFNETAQPLIEFYDGAFWLAIRTQTPILPIIFPYAANRWHYSAWWKLWPGNNLSVFLKPVSVAGLEKKDIPALKQHVYSLMENELAKYRPAN